MPQFACMKSISEQTKRQLVETGVSALYLFGSRAQGVSTEKSDFDFGILLSDPRALLTSQTALYDRLYPILASITEPETLEADVIDIVFLDSPRVPLEIKSHIINRGQILLDNDPTSRADKEADIMLKTADFAPLKKLMSEALIERPTV